MRPIAAARTRAVTNASAPAEPGVGDQQAAVRAHREAPLHAGERLGRAHRDDGDLAAARLDQLERELEAVLVAGVERAVARIADEQVVGPERGGARGVGDELREHGHVHSADAT